MTDSAATMTAEPLQPPVPAPASPSPAVAAKPKAVPPPIPTEYLSLTMSRRGTATGNNALSALTFTPPTPTAALNDHSHRPPPIPANILVIPSSPLSPVSSNGSMSPASPISPMPPTDVGHLTLTSPTVGPTTPAPPPPLPPRKPKMHSASASVHFAPGNVTGTHTGASTPNTKLPQFPPPPPVNFVKQRASILNKTMPSSVLAAMLAAGDTDKSGASEDSKESQSQQSKSRNGSVININIANSHRNSVSNSNTVSFVNRMSHSSVFNNLFFTPPAPSIIGLPPTHTSASSSEEKEVPETRPSVYDLPRARQIFTEMVETETRFVSHLKTLVSVFIEPLQSAINDSSSDSDVSDKFGETVLNPQIQVFFSTACQILSLNTKFSEELSSHLQSFDETTKVGDLFLHYAPLFRCYGLYAAGHETVTQMLNRALVKEKEFAKFCERANHDSRCQGQTLESLLIMPIQRIPRYRLLLEELRKRTPSDHCGYQSLLLALKQVQDSAKHINESIRQREYRDQLKELQSLFVVNNPRDDPQLLSSINDHHSRYLLRAGLLSRVTRRGKTDYYFHLLNDLLLYSEQNKNGTFKLHKRIELNDRVTVNDRPHTDNEPHALLIASPQKTFVVCCASAAEKQQWLESLIFALSSATGVSISTAAVADSDDIAADGTMDFVAPLWTSDHSASHCTLCQTSFTFFNRRHHCRSCGALCCHACSNRKLLIAAIHANEPQRVCDNCFNKGSTGATAIESPSSTSVNNLNTHRHSTSINARRLLKRQDSHNNASTSNGQSLMSAFPFSNNDWRDKLDALREDLNPDDQRFPVINDLIVSEHAYLRDLHILLDFYIKPLLRLIETSSSHGKTRTGEVGEIEGRRVSPMLAVFLTSLEPLYDLNCEFQRLLVSKLDDYSDEKTLFGECIHRYINLFPLYLNYSRNHARAVDTLINDFNGTIKKLEEEAKRKCKSIEKERQQEESRREESRRESRFESRLHRYNGANNDDDDDDNQHHGNEDGDETQARVSFDAAALAKAALRAKRERDTHKLHEHDGDTAPPSPQPPSPQPAPASPQPPPIPANLSVMPPPIPFKPPPSPPALPPRPLAPLTVPDSSPNPLSPTGISGNSTPVSRSSNESHSHYSTVSHQSPMLTLSQSPTLGNLTLQPLKRLGYYVSALSALLLLTPDTHPDYQFLSQSLTSLSTIWREIEAIINDGNNIRTMRALQAKFIASSIKDIWPATGNEHRRLLLEAKLMRVTTKGNFSYQFHLLSDALICSEVSNKGLKLHRWFDLREIQCMDSGVINDSSAAHLNGFVYQFTIISPQKTITVAASSEDQKIHWIREIKAAIKALYTKKSSTGRSSSVIIDLPPTPSVGAQPSCSSSTMSRSASKSNLTNLLSPSLQPMSPNTDEPITPLVSSDSQEAKAADASPPTSKQ